MSKFERVLAEGSTELPDCRCSVEMHLISIVPMDGTGSEIRIFRCPGCNHELRLTIWRNNASTVWNIARRGSKSVRRALVARVALHLCVLRLPRCISAAC